MADIDDIDSQLKKLYDLQIQEQKRVEEEGLTK